MLMVKNLKRWIATWTFVVLLPAISIADDTPLQQVRLATDIWCPYNCSTNAENKGLFHDIVTASLAAENFQIQYDTYSWTRAIEAVKSGHHDILLGATPRLENDLLFYSDFKLKDETVFVTLEKNNINISSIEELLNYNLGLLANYTYVTDPQWEQAIQNHPNSIRLNSAYGESKLLEMLARERINVAASNYYVAQRFFADKPQYKVRYIRNNFKLGAHIAFTKSARGQALYRAFDAGFKKLIHTERYKDIFKTYGLVAPE